MHARLTAANTLGANSKGWRVTMEERKARSDIKCSFANSRTVASSGLWFEEGEETEVSTPG